MRLRARGGERVAKGAHIHTHVACRGCAQLNNKINAYHQAATALHLLPATAKYAGGVDFEIRLAPAGNHSSDLLATDIEGHIQRSLRKLKQDFTSRRFAGLTSCDDLNDAVAERQEALAAARAEITTLESRLHRLDENFKLEKTTLERGLAAERDEMETLEAEIDRTREAASEEAVEDAGLEPATLAAQEAAAAAHAEALARKREAVRAKIATALEHLTDHKDYIQRRLQASLEATTAKRDLVKAELRPVLA